MYKFCIVFVFVSNPNNEYEEFVRATSYGDAERKFRAMIDAVEWIIPEDYKITSIELLPVSRRMGDSSKGRVILNCDL